MEKSARQQRYTTNWGAVAAERAHEIAVLKSRIVSIVLEIGGTVEGHPTGPHNVLQRVRELIDCEKAVIRGLKPPSATILKALGLRMGYDEAAE